MPLVCRTYAPPVHETPCPKYHLLLSVGIHGGVREREREALSLMKHGLCLRVAGKCSTCYPCSLSVPLSLDPQVVMKPLIQPFLKLNSTVPWLPNLVSGAGDGTSQVPR